MIYIHNLKDLSAKTADIESVPIIRELRKSVVLPISEEKLHDSLREYFMLETDERVMVNALSLIEPTVERIKEIFEQRDPLYEPINLKRAVDMLIEICTPLENNIMYTRDVYAAKNNIIVELGNIFNNISKLKSQEELRLLNQKLNDVFKKVLRNENMELNVNGIVSEPQLERINALNRNIENGFLFHISIEEELSKKTFNIIKQRIPYKELERVERIMENIRNIKDGVEVAYRNNMRMVNLALLLYSYIKFLTSKWIEI